MNKPISMIRNIMYLSKNCEKSALFFVDILGLKINHMSEEYAELIDNKNSKIVFKYSNR